jgi:hypothetical protein
VHGNNGCSFAGGGDRHGNRDQVPTAATTAQRIVRSLYFAAGVEDVRRGLPPRFDMMQQDVTSKVGNGQL